MNRKMSQRYQKVLVTVAMGFRTEEDVERFGLHRFTKQKKDILINYVKDLFLESKNVLALKVKQTGYSTEHIEIHSDEALDNFLNNIDNIFDVDNEIWVVESSAIECWRCRIYISKNGLNDMVEMAYSFDDHIIDHIDAATNVPYVCYQLDDKIKVFKSTLADDKLVESRRIVEDVLLKYASIFNKVRKDLDYLGINGISLDFRVNNGYNFHDFDVSYENVEKVIKYYLNI